MSDSRRISLGLAALVLLVYLPDLRNGFVYDDHEVVLQQAPVRSAAELARVFAEPHGLPQSQLPYYRPITRATLLLQKGLHGDAAPLFHLANAALMSATAVVAFALLRTPAFALSPWAAAWGAAAFAVHPIASECVHPIASGRESAMPAFFMIATLAFWMRGRRALAYLAFAAALWSKEQAITVPLLAAWADLLGLAPGAPGRRIGAWLRRMAPFALVTLAYLAVRGEVVPQDEAEGEFVARLAAHWSAHPFAPLEAALFVLQSTFAPNAQLAYEPSFETWFSVRSALLATITFAAMVGALVRELAFPRRVVAFWVGWIPLAMLLNANILPIETAFAERYLLVSSLGIAALFASAGDRVAQRAGTLRKIGIAIASVVLLALLAAMTIHRSRYYRDEIAFGRQWAATSPQHANAQASLGAALARAELDAEAIAALREAVRLEPALASAHYNLGVVLARRGARDEAIAAFAGALRAHPGDADAHYALGVLLAQRGATGEAASHLREALRLRPGFAEAATALRSLDSRPE